MLTLTSAEMSTWVAGLMWPLARILGLITASPVFGHTRVPITVKLLLGLSLAIVIAPVVPAGPAADPASLAGFLILAQETLIGIAMGFSMRLVFAAVQTAGEFVGLQMGLSFASFFDPSTGANTAVLSRLFNIVAMLTFLALDGHLLVLAALVRSFDTLPVAAIQLHQNGWGVVVEWGKTVFVSGLLLALPLICALLTINLAMGILNRAAPQLSVFSVGFPVSLIVGVVLLTVVLPNSGPFLESLFESGLSAMSRVADALAGR